MREQALVARGNAVGGKRSFPADERQPPRVSSSVLSQRMLSGSRPLRMGRGLYPNARRGNQSASSWKWIRSTVINSMVMKNGMVPQNTSPIEPSPRTAWIT